MEIKDICNTVTGSLSISEFLNQYRDDILYYKRASENSNESATVKYNEEVSSVFGVEMLLGLFLHYVEGNIYEWELDYILNVIEASCEDEDPRTEEIIFSFANPYLNYNISMSNIKSAINYLTNSLEELNLDNTDRYRNNYRSILDE